MLRGGRSEFEIRQFQVDGNTLLQPDGINRALAPFTGKQKDFGDVQRALEALQEHIIGTVTPGVQWTLPEQELEKGEVRFCRDRNQDREDFGRGQ